MTLGGLAIAVGLLVDAAIIMVENILHRLSGATTRRERRERAVSAAVEVARPIAFATFIVIVVFLPLFGMTGIEGRMYQPLAAAVIAAMIAALVLALTLVPIVAAMLLRPSRPGANEDVLLLRKVKQWYAPLLDRCLRHPRLVALVTLLVAVPAIALGFRIGSDFMPQLDEGAFLLQTVLPAEAALEEVDRLNHRVEDILREIPEVEDVVRRTGRAERTEDPMPHTLSDVLVVLKPDRTRSLEDLETDMREKLEGVPGVAVLFTTPLGMRIDEGLGGTPADISVRIFGPDLDELSRLAERAEALIRGVDGLTDLRAEQLTGLPQLQIAVNREASARVGLAPGDVIRAVRIGLVGEEASQIWIGQRRFDLLVRLRDDRRDSLEAIRTLLIDGHDGTRIPLGQLADVTQTFGPAAIRREAGTRRIAVEATVSGRDLGSTASDVRRILSDQLKLPSGYFFDLGGRVESQARASRALTLGDRGGALWRVRPAPGGARFGRRSRHDPGHRPDRVRRRNPGAAPRRRDMERLLAGRFDRPLWHRCAEQSGSRDADAGIAGRRPKSPGSGARGKHRSSTTKADDGRDRDTRLAPHAGVALARHRDRASSRRGHDRRVGDIYALHAAGASDVLPAGTRMAGAPSVAR